MELTRRGWIQGIVSSVVAAAVVVKATPAEAALVKVGAPADLLVTTPERMVSLPNVLPTLYVKTLQGDFEPFAECTDLSMSIERHDVTTSYWDTRTYVQGLPRVEGRFVVIGGIRYQIDNAGKRHWGRA